jgi:hypothetical protein
MGGGVMFGAVNMCNKIVNNPQKPGVK